LYAPALFWYCGTDLKIGFAIPGNRRIVQYRIPITLSVELATTLDLHSRVLQRRLKADGTSFSKLVKETRRDIACQHLCDGEMNITDVALKLGYAEVAIFSRNFKQWTGLSPRQWRKEKGKERP